MFSIYLLDSSKLFQWDLNRKIKIIGKEEVDEVHFSHIGDEEALVVKPIKENNILIAKIPNILLQESKDIFVYLVSKDKTLKETFFTVGRREKPTDYLYTEIDILNYSSLEKRLAELEEKLNNISVEETDPTVPDWAKQPNKPRYTAAEVGALSSTETVRQLAQKQDKSNLVTSINESSVDSTYPSTRAVYEYVGEEFARLVGSAPDALNTIEELAAAFNDNQDVVEALNTSIANKQDKVDSVGLKIAQGGEIFNDYQNNTASREYSHAEGLSTKALAPAAHSEGEGTFARTTGSHAEGMSTEAGQENGQSYAHAEGVSSKAYGRGSHAEGELTLAQGNYSHAEGSNSQATGAYAHAEGYKNGNAKTTASGQGSHAEGHGTTAEGTASHSEGEGTHALGELSHAEGRLSKAAGRGSHAEGDSTIAGDGNANLSNDVSALEAYQNQVPGAAAHTEGIGTLAKKAASHAEGYKTISEGNAAHAEGNLTKAQGNSAHSEGFNTIASSDYQHVQGKYNIEDTSNQYAHIIGGGSSNSDRKNIHTIKWDGTAEYQGDVVANACGGTNPISLVDTFNKLNDKIDSPNIATAGQLLSVKSVDENGKPTEWETMVPYATDISKTPGYQKTATAQQIIIDISNPFSLGLYFSSSLLTYFKIMNGDQELNKYTLGQPRLIEFTKISATDVIFVFYYRTQHVVQYRYSVNSNSWEEKILNHAAASIKLKLDEKISNPLTASVGQILEVEEVDENGVPTKWKAVDKLADVEGLVEITDGEPTKESTVMILNPNAEEINLYTAEEIDAIVSEFRENQSFDFLVSNAEFKKGYKLSATGEEEIKAEGGVSSYISVAGASKIKIIYSTLDVTKGTSVVEYDNDDNFVTRSTIWTNSAEEPIIKDYEFIILLNPNTKRIRISLNELSDVFCNITFYNLPINRYCYSRDDIDAMFGSYATDIASLIGGIE